MALHKVSHHKWKVGDKAVCVLNDCGAHSPSNPTELLALGEEIKIHHINSDGDIVTYLDNDFNKWVIYTYCLKPVGEVPKIGSLKCDCSIQTLMLGGCKCGFIDVERKNKE